ncbi:DUF418 domain-containing protein [Corynebacterium liangguodongii]|uniref:Uncharacterized protein n=1 Tax=Corynebacterium liangguodongii TaxID=2079535 RepID=A0A2S0WCU6_9CORY|nr:DUF418 domain-containing protein [Corynebacterium liangguodongii]AWB83589.1 hypothetical protein C3E79_03030 [Corynebacterium liangguodongii]PWB98619.1 DUF418 domain-containing protein [Corynebacterium liangguodongii]
MSDRQRLLVPDLARGVSLGGIACANATTAWMTDANTAPGSTLGGVTHGSTVDQVLAVLTAMFIHVRGLPMFSTLLGFGFGLVVSSLYRKRYPLPAARGILARRYAILAAFGFAHMFAVFYGDIMAMYGLIGVVLAMLFAVGSTWLRVIAYVPLTLFALTSAAGAAAAYFWGGFAAPELRSVTADLDSLPTYLGENLSAAVQMALASPFAVLELGGLTIIGYIWAREGYLVEVDKHRRILLAWAALAAAIILAVGLPWGLSAIGVLDPQLEEPLAMLNQGVGAFIGPGILAAFALLSHAIRDHSAWVYPFVALGKRSMSGYLAQSFLFIILVMPFGFGLGLEASISGKIALGLLVWVITLVAASLLEAAGRQGPFEWAHRRLSYGPTGRIEPRDG